MFPFHFPKIQHIVVLTIIAAIFALLAIYDLRVPRTVDRRWNVRSGARKLFGRLLLFGALAVVAYGDVVSRLFVGVVASLAIFFLSDRTKMKRAALVGLLSLEAALYLTHEVHLWFALHALTTRSCAVLGTEPTIQISVSQLGMTNFESACVRLLSVWGDSARSYRDSPNEIQWIRYREHCPFLMYRPANRARRTPTGGCEIFINTSGSIPIPGAD